MNTHNSTIINTLRILARDIESEDGVANAALHEAAERFVQLVAQNKRLKKQLGEAISHAQALRGDFGDDACLHAEDALTELVNTVNEEVLLPSQCQSVKSGQDGKDV